MPDRYARRILDHLADRRYQPRNLRQLIDDLGITAEQRADFINAVEDLLKKDQLVCGSEDTIGLPPVGDDMVGRFRSHERGFGFVVPDELTEHGDLFIPPGKSGDAMDGDRVRAKVRRERGRGGGGRSPFTGTIVEVVQRADRQFVGTLMKKGKTHLVNVDGRAISEPIIIRDAGAKNARVGDKVVIDIIDYPDAKRNELAEGVIVEVLGESGLPDVETQSVMRAYSLAEKFDKQVVSEARAASQKMEAAEDNIPEDREDLRETLIATIDPPNAKDFDDAISITKLEGKGDAAWELGVHIADVAHFVELGGALDQEAYNRGNSTYLPRKVIPMLPEVLSNGVCSLQEGVDRFAKSVFIRYDAEGHVLGQRFAKTVIRSAKRLTYLEAQALIDDDLREARKHCKSEAKYPRELIKALKLMNELSRTIRSRRFKQGMITLGLPEVELVFDDAGHVVDAQPEDDAYTHTLIEMFMVEANEAAARLFNDLKIPMIRRVHADPDAHGLKDLRTFARVAGFNIPAKPSRKELQWLLDKVRDTPAQHAVHMAVLKTLSRAEYAPTPIGHFALASEHYTHFTSPIRRYPDFVVHRSLNAVLDKQREAGLPMDQPLRGKGLKQLSRKVANDERVPSEEELVEIGRHCSTTERNSTDAERELRKFLVLQLLSTRLGEDFSATVTGVTGQGAFLQIDAYLVDGFVKLPDLPGDKADRWQLNPNTGALVAQRSGRTIAIGDRFTARVANIDLPRRQMELVILDDRKPRRKQDDDKKQPGKKKKRGVPQDRAMLGAKDRKGSKVTRRKKSSTMKKKKRSPRRGKR
ncbi:MAG: VacB/RNase II family 3'-5' exoribonuclease [Phycisphaeraceae bacterium]|nr:VacB/RNase II family 3'-5' exoribonuclease [Phycisphaeraceae bacterium]